jgi:hypothetical protein
MIRKTFWVWIERPIEDPNQDPRRFSLLSLLYFIFLKIDMGLGDLEKKKYWERLFEIHVARRSSEISKAGWKKVSEK